MNDSIGGLNLTIVIEPGEESGYVAHCPELKGCWSCGDNEAEALANIEEAIIACLKVRLKWAIEDAMKVAASQGESRTIQLAMTNAYSRAQRQGSRCWAFEGTYQRR